MASSTTESGICRLCNDWRTSRLFDPCSSFLYYCYIVTYSSHLYNLKSSSIPFHQSWHLLFLQQSSTCKISILETNATHRDPRDLFEPLRKPIGPIHGTNSTYIYLHENLLKINQMRGRVLPQFCLNSFSFRNSSKAQVDDHHPTDPYPWGHSQSGQCGSVDQ